MEVQPATVQPGLLPTNPRVSWRLLLPLLFVVVFLLILFFAFGDDFGRRNMVMSNLAYKANFSFSSEQLKDRYQNLINEADATVDKKKRFEILLNAFSLLQIDYSANPTKEKRAELSRINDLLYKEFPAEAKSSGISVPCLEESCGAKPSYSKGLEDIVTKIQNLKLDDGVKQTLVENLRNASQGAGSDNKQGEFSALYADFQILRTEWQESQAADVKNLIDDVLALMKTLDSASYDQMSRLDLLKLEK